MTSPGWKWPGGKRNLLDEVSARAPSATQILERGGRYAEFFIGGGATFLGLYEHVRPAWISDGNIALVDVYQQLQRDPEPVLALLRGYENTEADFYRIRKLDHRSMCPHERAAWLLYLLRFCFNGLARFDRRGRFTASYCKAPTRQGYDETKLVAVGHALQGVEIHRADFAEAFAWFKPRRGDFVYLDPPYVPVSTTSRFTSYSADEFGWQQQSLLCLLSEQAMHNDADILIHNSWVPETQFLYRAFKQARIEASRAIAADGAARDAVSEIVAYTFVAKEES